MFYNLNILIDRAERALLRTLGVIERRGFILESVSLPHTLGDERRVAVRVAPRDGNRSIEVLARQLERLENVLAIEVHAMRPVSHAAPAFQPAGARVAVATASGNGHVFEEAVS